LTGERGLRDAVGAICKRCKKFRKQQSGVKEIACYNIFTVIFCIKRMEYAEIVELKKKRSQALPTRRPLSYWWIPLQLPVHR
jgi:hypothetical protein